MSYQFNDDDKEVREFAETMPFGITVVQVTGALADQTEKGVDFIEVGVVAENGVEDSAKLFFTGGASNISFNTLRQIAVHCAETEEAKEAARQRVDAVKDGDELAAVISELCTGKQIWFTKYYDAKGRTFTNEHGTFKSINKNVLGYEPKLKTELMPKPANDDGEAKEVDTPFGKATDAGATVPKDGDWAK